MTRGPPGPAGAQGAVARYAWIDYYAQLREGLRVISRRIRDAGHRAVVFADDNSIVDREVAYLAGIGWFGKNANLLLPGLGSWFVLGSNDIYAPRPLNYLRYFIRHRTRRRRVGERLWTLAVLEAWLRVFIDGKGRPPGGSA